MSYRRRQRSVKLSSMTIQLHHCVCFMSHTNGTPAARSRDEFATIKEEKELKKDSANFTIAMCHWSCAILYTASNKWDFTFHIWKVIGD